MAKKTTAAKKQKSFEESLWDTATKLRGSVESSEYSRERLPPVDRDEVYKEIFEQAENFKKYQNS